MTNVSKSPIDLLDDIYTLGYWMTDSETLSLEFVNKTYRNAGCNTEESSLLKSFRVCCKEWFGESADIKLTVLLSEISGLQHHQIADIIEKPLDTTRLLLSQGRKLFINTSPLKATA